MYQADRGNYRTEESTMKAFRHSCLGRLTIYGGILLILLFIAYITTPTEQDMLVEMDDNILQCLQENDSIKGDAIDDYVNNPSFIITKADTTEIAPETIKAYRKLNRLEAYRHTFYATAYLINNVHPEGVRVGFGVFNTVIPTVTYKDILLDVGPIHKGYNQKIIKQSVPDTDLGHNPNVTEFHYQRNPEN